MMRGYYGGVGGFGALLGILMMLFMIALIVLIVIFIVRLIRRGSDPHYMHGGFNRPPIVPQALEILNQRLAKGEITLEEYQHLKSEILRQ
jgi:putative membrane protein